MSELRALYVLYTIRLLENLKESENASPPPLACTGGGTSALPPDNPKVDPDEPEVETYNPKVETHDPKVETYNPKVENSPPKADKFSVASALKSLAGIVNYRLDWIYRYMTTLYKCVSRIPYCFTFLGAELFYESFCL